MSANSRSGVEFRENSRAPLQAPATIQIDAFSEPLTGFTANVSKGGMFVQMTDLPSVGSIVRFQVELGDPPGPVGGTAEVVWMRTQAQGPERPAGVGLQFRFIEKNGAPVLSAAVHKVLEELGPEPEPAQPVRKKPRPPRPPRPPADESVAKPSKKKPTQRQKAAPKKKSTDDSKQILGMPAEKAKLILLLVLMAFLLLTFLL